MPFWNEQDRIAALQRYEILDTVSDADYSDFVQIASDICNAPIAAINLIDGGRHWSLTGIDHGDQELPLSQSICAETIRQPDLLIVPDLSSDARFHDNPLVSDGPKLRFYAGAQLLTPEGLPIGTVCVLDYKPRPDGLSNRQRFTLEALARQIMTQLELRRAMLDITSGNLLREKLEESLREKEALRQAEVDLARISRVTTMGQLTASIAHEVNQPLMAIVMNADACVQWLDDSQMNIGEARAAAMRAVAEGHRAGQIIDTIRAMARNAPAMVGALDINELIENMLAIVRAEFRHRGLRFDTDLQQGAINATGDRIQLQQVLLNLLSNAADAVTASDNQDRHLSIASRMDESGEVRVSVEDSGQGIDPAIADRIFHPFFTTKHDGIGMGLSICRSIIDRHGGRLWVEPRHPDGSRFSFSLPPSAGSSGG
jgi:signal transduction histidine kinase